MPETETGRVGGAITVVPGSPTRIETDEPHMLSDGDLVRVEGVNGGGPMSDECYISAAGLSDRQCTLFTDETLKTPATLSHTYPANATLARLAKDDVAVAVGITKYAALKSLNGPETDANAFRDWVRSSSGGCVPDTQARLILSSMFAATGEPSLTKPTLEEMKAEFKRYVEIASKKPGFRVGRRLYIFLSGHGITPTHSNIPNFEEPALLAANATSWSLGEHITGAAYAEWFRANGLFDEVILFADCCKDLKDNVTPTPPPFPTITPERAPGRRFYAAATKLDSKAFEKPCGNPPAVRGVFSYVLMNALENGALRNASGWLTGSVLARYLYQAVPQQQKGQEPVIDFREQEDIQFVHRRATGPNVSISFPTAWIGKEAQLIGRKYPTPDAVHTITANPWTLSLEMEMYIVKAEGLSRHFEIDGCLGVKDVSFV